MIRPANHRPRLDWHSLDEKERLVWAVAFVAGERAAEVGADVAAAMVERLRATEFVDGAMPAPATDPNGELPLQHVLDAFFHSIESRKGVVARTDRALQPVREALAHGVSITPEEFQHWYPVAYRIAMRGESLPHHPTTDEIARAMEAYGKGRLDVF